MFDTHATYVWMTYLVVINVVIQTFEILTLDKEIEAVWKQDLFRNSFFGFIFYFGLPPYLYLNLVLCGYLLFSPTSGAAVLMLVIQTLVFLRFRGPLNGGSDYMTTLVILALALFSLVKQTNPVGQVALWYVGVQVVLSYFVAGLAKARHREWWTGAALKNYLLISNYAVATPVKKWALGQGVSKIVSWIVLLFELSFPLCILSPKLCLVYISMAVIFHLTNAYVLGLNRFLFSWVAAYPALYFLSLQFSKT